MKNWLIRKDSEAGKDWRQEEEGVAEDEMVGYRHWLNRREFEPAPGVADWQGSMACCSPWDHKELETTEWLNLTERCTKVFFQLFNWPTSANWLWFQPHFLQSQKGECFLVILAFLSLYMKSWFPRSLRHKESACKCRRCGFNPWVEKILEEKMETHYSSLARRIPWTDDYGQL